MFSPSYHALIKRIRAGLFPIVCLTVLPTAASCLAQDAVNSLAGGVWAPSVFLDCDGCDNDYIRREITVVNYVRDRLDADVHLLISTRRSGGGLEYTLQFIGRERFVAVGDTLRYLSSNTDSEDEERSGLVQMIKLGLAQYLARTQLADQLTVTYTSTRRPTGQTESKDDKWNSWVFSTGLNGSYSAEESTNFLRLGGDLRAGRVTEAWKILLSTDGTYRESNFDLGDETITSTTRDGSFRGHAVRSLGSQWAAGGFVSMTTSSFTNTDLSVSVSSALEYNLFPYSESASREFRFSYFLNLRAFDYESLTVFGKTSEVLMHHALEASLTSRQTWGSLQVSFQVSEYVTDFSESLADLYRIQLFGFIELRLVRGLSLVVNARTSRIRDQLFLPQEAAADDEILLQTRSLPTSFDYGFSLGFRYTFGSIYNNVVNSRFGP